MRLDLALKVHDLLRRVLQLCHEGPEPLRLRPFGGEVSFQRASGLNAYRPDFCRVIGLEQAECGIVIRADPSECRNAVRTEGYELTVVVSLQGAHLSVAVVAERLQFAIMGLDYGVVRIDERLDLRRLIARFLNDTIDHFLLPLAPVSEQDVIDQRADQADEKRQHKTRPRPMHEIPFPSGKLSGSERTRIGTATLSDGGFLCNRYQDAIFA